MDRVAGLDANQLTPNIFLPAKYMCIALDTGGEWPAIRM